MIISISGVPGSGKTSVGRILADRLKMKFISVGDLRGQMALARGLTLDELNALGEIDKSTDTQADDYQKELGSKEDNFIIEGRLSWHFIPQSYKLFLTCDPIKAAERIYQSKLTCPLDDRKDERAYSDKNDAQEAIEKRVASDVLRYQKHYGLDYRDPANFDLIVDTTGFASAVETTEHILAELGRLSVTGRS